MTIHFLMIIDGILMTGWGLWASYYKKKPFDTIGALFALSGLCMALIGALLVFVPDFFNEGLKPLWEFWEY